MNKSNLTIFKRKRFKKVLYYHLYYQVRRVNEHDPNADILKRTNSRTRKLLFTRNGTRNHCFPKRLQFPEQVIFS